jgi:hypothetical protein
MSALRTERKSLIHAAAHFKAHLIIVIFLVTSKLSADEVTQIVEEIKTSASQNELVHGTFQKNGLISDPSGFAKVYSGQGTHYSVLEIVKSQESIAFIGDGGQWCKVKTKAGTIGYVYSSQILPSIERNPVWLFADSSLRRLQPSELEFLSAEDLWTARNEIFARNGLIFQTNRGKNLGRKIGEAYFPKNSDQQEVFAGMNPVEQDNIKLIQFFESQRR